MANRERHYHLAMPGADGSSSDSDGAGDRFDLAPGLAGHVDMDSAEEFDGDGDAFFDERESPRPSSEEIDYNSIDGEDGTSDEDSLTWDTVSEGSVRVAPTEETREDEWFPLMWRREAFPNFVLPTTTRSAIPVPHDPVPPSISVITSAPSTSHATASHAPEPQSSSTNNMIVSQPFQFTSRTYNMGRPSPQQVVRPPSPTASEESESENGDYDHFVGVMRPEPAKCELLQTVLDYFLHHGHSEVVEIFCKEMKLPLPEKEIQEMNERNEVRDLIWAGEMEKAIERIPPKLLEDEEVNFAVRKQQIIEMIRAEQTEEPVDYFRKYLVINGKRPCDEKMDIVERIFTIMVYKDNNPNLKTYMGQEEREATAKVVNSALLANTGKSRCSKIDLLAKSIAWAQNEVALKQRPGSGSTTQAWADHLFAEPLAMNDFVSTAIKVCPLDQTEDLC